MNIDAVKRKLCLGTVQLGMKYGINNKSGQPDESEAYRILDKAAQEKIFLLDSAEAYGESLAVIGSYLRKRTGQEFRVISKFIGEDKKISQRVNTTLSLIGQPHLYALMYHRFSDYESGTYTTELQELKTSGKVANIGISLYSERELEIAIRDPDISLIQIPFHPFDASKNKKRLLQEAKRLRKEVHVRSVFLQGLFFKKPYELTGNMTALSAPLTQFHSVLECHGATVREACLNYVLHMPFVDKVIIGVDTVRQLEENIDAILPVCPRWISEGIELEVSRDAQPLLNPSNWKP